jgi:hypothetical protein
MRNRLKAGELSPDFPIFPASFPASEAEFAVFGQNARIFQPKKKHSLMFSLLQGKPGFCQSRS